MPDFHVELLHVNYVTDKVVGALNKLLKEFSPDSPEMSLDYARQMVQDEFVHIVERDCEEIVGMTTLVIYRKPTGRVGLVEDVIVAESCRGKGLGRMLMNEVIKAAKFAQLKRLWLTSNSSRVAARRLYESLGFVVKDTACLKLDL